LFEEILLLFLPTSSFTYCTLLLLLLLFLCSSLLEILSLSFYFLGERIERERETVNNSSLFCCLATRQCTAD